MPKDELLPGVTVAACPPAVVCDARGAIRKARRRALARDIAQVTVLFAVDYLFLRWPEARVPLLDRHESLRVVELTNAVVAVQMFCARYLIPRWNAYRAATTWSRAERERFTR